MHHGIVELTGKERMKLRQEILMSYVILAALTCPGEEPIRASQPIPSSSAEATTTILSEVNNQLPDSSFMADVHIRMETLKSEMDTIELEFREFEKGEFKSKAVLFLRNELSILDKEKESLSCQGFAVTYYGVTLGALTSFSLWVLQLWGNPHRGFEPCNSSNRSNSSNRGSWLLCPALCPPAVSVPSHILSSAKQRIWFISVKKFTLCKKVNRIWIKIT